MSLKGTLILTSHGMGPNASQEDYESYCSFVEAKVPEGLVVDTLRYGEPGSTKALAEDPETREEILNLAQDLWDQWCSRSQYQNETFKISADLFAYMEHDCAGYTGSLVVQSDKHNDYDVYQLDENREWDVVYNSLSSKEPLAQAVFNDPDFQSWAQKVKGLVPPEE